MAHLIGPQASWLGRNNDSALVMATSRLPKRRPWSPAAGRIRKCLRGPRFSGYRRTWCGDESDHWTNAALPAPSRVLTATWNSTGPCGFFCVCCRLVIFTKDHELRHPFWALSRRRPKIEGPKMAKMATLKSQAPGQPTKKSAGSMVMVWFCESLSRRREGRKMSVSGMRYL